MKAQKLKSGSYRFQVYAGKDTDGKPHYVSFTHPDKKEAERQALEFKLHHRDISRDSAKMTLGEAMDKYIESKDGVLSPTTVLNYKRQRHNWLQGIIDIPLGKLSQETVQQEINQMSKKLSPKTVKNAHGLLTAVLSVYHPNLTLKTTLPQTRPYESNIPTESDIKRIVEITRGTNIELPVLLALCLGLRMSEIRGIEWNAIKGNTVTINKALVSGESSDIAKTTKSKAGHRAITLPQYIIDLINQQPKESNYIIPKSGKYIYDIFTKLCAKNGLPHFRFHDLRHANASVMLALGVPDKYAMERGGWATNHTMKNVYQHTMSEQRAQIDNRINDYFNGIISHEISHSAHNN